MHLKTCCALLLLALVACQAAPSPATEEQPIAEPDPQDASVEEAGDDAERSKKSTTLCVEFRSGKEQQVPCSQVQQQQPAVYVQGQPKQLVYLSQPQQTVVQPTPQTHFIQVQEKPQHQQNVVIPQPQQVIQPGYSTVQIVQPQPTIQVAPQPTVQVQTRPSVEVRPQQTVHVQQQPTVHVQPQPTVQMQTRPTVQVQQQPTVQVQTRPTAVQVQPQSTTVQVQTQPTVQVIHPQPIPQHVFQVQPQHQQQHNTVVMPAAPVPQKTQIMVPNYKVESSAPCASEVLIQPQVELITPQIVPQVFQQQPTIIEVPYSVQETQTEDESYECSCHPGKQNSKNKYGKITDILTVYPGASIVSPFVSNGQLVGSSQFAAGSPIFTTSPAASADNQFASNSPIVSSSATLGGFSGAATLGHASTGGPLGTITGAAPFGTIAGSASPASISGDAALGPVSGGLSLKPLSGSSSLKSPLLAYNINTGITKPAQEETEARRHKHNKVPAQISLQVPVSPIAYQTANVPNVQYYSPASTVQYYNPASSYYPSTSQVSYNPNTYYENTYALVYPNTYTYPTETSSPSITLNASGLYRDSQYADNMQETSTTATKEAQKESSSATVSNTEGNSINAKREATQEPQKQIGTVQT